MSFCFESLESRRLLSNTAITTLHTDAATLHVVDNNINKFVSTSLIGARIELRTAGELRGSLSDYNTLLHQSQTDERALRSAVILNIAKVNLDAARLNAVEHLLTLHPSNTTLQTRASADMTTLTSDATAAQTSVNNLVTTLNTDTDTNFNTLATDNSSDTTFSTNVMNFETSLSTGVTSTQTDANTVFTTDTAAVNASF